MLCSAAVCGTSFAGADAQTPMNDAKARSQHAGADGRTAERELARAIRRIAHPLRNRPTDYDDLLLRIGDARVVLLGEDTHGTSEFYRERARITQRLIADHGFTGVVIEADWAEVAGLRTYVAGAPENADVAQALRSFQRFPRWMWRNADFRDLLVWLRHFNLERTSGMPAVGLYGMDFQEIAPAANAVIAYLAAFDTEAAERARQRYDCLLAPAGAATASKSPLSPRWPEIDCAQPVQEALTGLSTAGRKSDAADSELADAAYLDALQGARGARNAEEYYRPHRPTAQASWNVRDGHMAATIDLLLAHLDATNATNGARSRLVVWAHNAHVGDARLTARGDAGWQTIGQMMRERYVEGAAIVGFITASGTVRAATDWGGRDRSRRMRAPLRGSHAALLHATGLPRFYLLADESPEVAAALDVPRPQRGIGVRYLPRLERAGHYYDARLSRQFDAIVHIDRTRALRPWPREDRE